VARRRLEGLSIQQTRERVNRVMEDWRSYPDFAHLFAALMQVNDISDLAFAQQYSQATHPHLSESEVNRIRHGAIHPSYRFVAHIADHALLSLDPDRMRPGNAHRLALFAAAGLIEVTPASVRQWNEEVLASWRRQCEPTTARTRITWRELMGKLLSFHCQGGRWSQRDIADAVNALPGWDGTMTIRRIKDILSDPTAVPTRAERLALAKIDGLDSTQIYCLESAVEDGILPLTPAPSPSRFSAQLSDLLGRLHQAGIAQAQVVARTIPLGQTEPELSTATLSMWKNGRTHPTLATLRALAQALERCQDRSHCPLVTAEEIRQLVSLAGFTLDDLAATTHDIVAQINGATQLKPLLSALRNAADLNVPTSAIDSASARGQTDTDARLVHLLKSWECEAAPNSPTPAQVGELLMRYNRLLRAAGKAELSSAEIQKVVEVAQRDREDGQQRGFSKRVQEHRPPSPRRTIRPDFDGGQAQTQPRLRTD
jgi:transcriptional regulator with XRE-family HTH domain